MAIEQRDAFGGGNPQGACGVFLYVVYNIAGEAILLGKNGELTSIKLAYAAFDRAKPEIPAK